MQCTDLCLGCVSAVCDVTATVLHKRVRAWLLSAWWCWIYCALRKKNPLMSYPRMCIHVCIACTATQPCVLACMSR